MAVIALRRCCPPVFADSFNDQVASEFSWQLLFVGATFTDDVQRYTDADGIMYPNVFYPSGGAINIPIPERQAAKVRVRFSDSESGSAQAQLWMGYGIDGPDIDRLIAELDCAQTCGVLRIIARIEGVAIGTVAAVNLGPVAREEWHTLTVCYTRDTITGEAAFTALLTLSDGRPFRLAIDADAIGWTTDPSLNGTGTRQVSSGMEVDFDDFKMLPHKDDSGSCGCGCPDCSEQCTQAREEFTRTEIGCCWQHTDGTPANTGGDWVITAGELERVASTADVLLYACGGAPASFSWSGDLYLPATGSKAGLLVGLTDAVAGTYYVTELEAGEECGKLRIIQGTVGGADTVLGEWVAIPGLTAETFHSLRVCYNPAHQVLTAIVNGSDAHHVKAVTDIPEDHFVGLRVDTGSGYKFDNFLLSWSQDTTYTSGSVGEDNPCPCCKISGCESITLTTFDDCRYDVTGTASGTTLAADTFALIRHSWSGVDSFCEADPTQHIQITFTASDFADVIRAHLDVVDDSTSHYAELTLNADAETQGTLKLYKNGLEIATTNVTALPGSYTLKVCYDQVTLTAVLNGEQLDEVSEGNGGLLAAVSTGTVTTTVDFESVFVSYKSYEDDCADCFGGPAEANCGPCLDGLIPPAIKLRLSNAQMGVIDPEMQGGECGTLVCNDCPSYDGSYILPVRLGGAIIGCSNAPGTLGDCRWFVEVTVDAPEPCSSIVGNWHFSDVQYCAALELDEVLCRHRLVGTISIQATDGFCSASSIAVFYGPWHDGCEGVDCITDFPYDVLTFDHYVGTVNFCDFSGSTLEALPV